MKISFFNERRMLKKTGYLVPIFALLFLAVFPNAGSPVEGRWVSIKGASDNFRDAGGYKADGSTIETGVLYRAGDISGIDGSGAKALKELGIKTVVDMRDVPADAKLERVLSDAGIRLVGLPMKSDSLGDRAEFYRRIIVLGRKSLISLLDLLSDENNLPVLIFDGGGVHEVEVATIFVLGAVGVSGDDCISDYLLSNEKGADLKRGWGEHIIKYFDDYGGVEHYITTILKVSPATMKKVKKNLVK
jgi:hypothetical protein